MGRLVLINVQNAGLRIELDADATTVTDLKIEISKRHPTHPAPAAQKLIWGGRYLADASQRLRDVFVAKVRVLRMLLWRNPPYMY